MPPKDTDLSFLHSVEIGANNHDSKTRKTSAEVNSYRPVNLLLVLVLSKLFFFFPALTKYHQQMTETDFSIRLQKEKIYDSTIQWDRKSSLRKI